MGSLPPMKTRKKKKNKQAHASGRVLKFCIAKLFFRPQKCAFLSSSPHHDTICLAHAKKLRAAHEVHTAVAVNPVLLDAAAVARLIVVSLLRPTQLPNSTTTREGHEGSEDQKQRPDAGEKDMEPLRSPANVG